MISVWLLKIWKNWAPLLSGLYDLPRFDTTGANLQSTIAACRHLNPDRLKIRIKAPACFIVSVGNVIPKLRPFAADVTSLCHK